jgi:putative ABC transport system permease protein
MSSVLLSILRLPLALAMLLYQSVVLAVTQIWANKTRGVLTTLGILIGVAAISAVIALIAGMRDGVLAEFEEFGTNRLSIEPDGRLVRQSWAMRTKVVFRTSDFDDLLERCPSVASLTRDCGMGLDSLTASGSKAPPANTHMRGIDAEWHMIERRGVSAGRPLTEMDNLQHRRVMLIDEKLSDLLQLGRDPVGKVIETGFWGRFLVVGMLEPSAVMMGRDSRMGHAVIPFNYTSYMLKNYPLWFEATAVARSREQLEDAKAEIEFYLRQKRGIRPGQPDTFRVETAAVAVQKLNDVSAMMTTIAGGIVAVSLLVGGVGIMNIMLVSVSERTREIGLRKALGAKPRAILLQFLVEAVVLCLLGGALGLIAGQGLTSFVASYLPSRPSQLMYFDPMDDDPPPQMETGGLRIWLPPAAIELAITFSVAVGLIFGIFPALKAASLDPIEALRHE